MLTFNENNYAIAMTRGDSESLTVRKKVDGGSAPFEVGEVITLTVRDGADGEIVFRKVVTEFDEEGAAVIAIETGDTEGAEFGKYVYDVQYTDAAGKIQTVIPPTPGKLPKFTLTEEATY